ncbi:MAG: Lar family restriction alleviation protein [Chelatococcus sp.]|nr:Lar family restriction alleviation protein [Chelatococcus sp. YT9]MBS7698562.1 Lar family restriction alleviation protein [Chelatococcus sp. YT9]MBX3559815.1 Lar family restriction alleviation protein [Chelatococcus sp.]
MARIAKRKPCPFCGTSDSFVECMDYGDFAVICNSCLARGPSGEGDGCDPSSENHRGERNATREWNKRTRAKEPRP